MRGTQDLGNFLLTPRCMRRNLIEIRIADGFRDKDAVAIHYLTRHGHQVAWVKTAAKKRLLRKAVFFKK